MQSAVLVAGEEIGKGALAHLERGLLDGLELVLDVLVVLGQVGDAGNDFAGLGVTSLEDEPARRLGQEHDEGENEEAEDDLESQGESPRDRAWREGEAEIDPVGNHDTARDEGTLNHDQLTTFVS